MWFAIIQSSRHRAVTFFFLISQTTAWDCFYPGSVFRSLFFMWCRRRISRFLGKGIRTLLYTVESANCTLCKTCISLYKWKTAYLHMYGACSKTHGYMFCHLPFKVIDVAMEPEYVNSSFSSSSAWTVIKKQLHWQIGSRLKQVGLTTEQHHRLFMDRWIFRQLFVFALVNVLRN